MEFSVIVLMICNPWTQKLTFLMNCAALERSFLYSYLDKCHS